MDGDPISLIGASSAKLTYIRLGQLYFKDSFKMLPASLASMCSIKTPEEEKLANEHLYEYLSEYSEIFKRIYSDENGVPIPAKKEQFFNSTARLLQKKGLFPYSLIASEKVLTTKAPYPAKSFFYNKLRKEDCTDEEYNDAKHLYEETGCEALGDSMALYNITDTVFLMVICKIRFGMLKREIGLHPANFTSMSSLSVCAMSRRSRCFIQYLPSDEVLAVVQAVTRGGYSCVHLRLGIDTRWIDGECYMYADGKLVRIVGNVVMNDENNQYGGAMTQPLPTGNYRIRKDLKTYESLVEHYKTRENVSYCAMVDMYLPDEKVNNFKPQDNI